MQHLFGKFHAFFESNTRGWSARGDIFHIKKNATSALIVSQSYLQTYVDLGQGLRRNQHQNSTCCPQKDRVIKLYNSPNLSVGNTSASTWEGEHMQNVKEGTLHAYMIPYTYTRYHYSDSGTSRAISPARFPEQTQACVVRYG